MPRCDYLPNTAKRQTFPLKEATLALSGAFGEDAQTILQNLQKEENFYNTPMWQTVIAVVTNQFCDAKKIADDNLSIHQKNQLIKKLNKQKTYLDDDILL